MHNLMVLESVVELRDPGVQIHSPLNVATHGGDEGIYHACLQSVVELSTRVGKTWCICTYFWFSSLAALGVLCAVLVVILQGI